MYSIELSLDFSSIATLCVAVVTPFWATTFISAIVVLPWLYTTSCILPIPSVSPIAILARLSTVSADNIYPSGLLFNLTSYLPVE